MKLAQRYFIRQPQQNRLYSITQSYNRPLRQFTSNQNQAAQQDSVTLNLVQKIENYQLALKYATDNRYEDSLSHLQKCITDIENVIGNTHSPYHLYVFQRIASIQTILQDAPGVESTFLRCTETANKLYPRNKEDAPRRFMWHNNLLKFYIDCDIDKACDYGSDLLSDYEQVLNNSDLTDLKFSLATSYSLQGIELDSAEKLFTESLEIAPPEMKGYIYNNHGINHFYQFVEKSQSIAQDKEMKDVGKPQMLDELAGKGLDKIQEMLRHMEGAIVNLKLSVRAIENFDTRFKDLEPIHEDTVAYPEAHQPELKRSTSMEQISEKLFLDEFFDPRICRDFLPKDFKHYDLKKHIVNEKFLKNLITQPQSILPIQNLGELAYIVQKYKEAFAFLDICMKVYKNIDVENLLKFKCLSLLGGLLESQGDHSSMMSVNQLIFKQLEKHNCYEKVFALRNYGYILAKNNETRLEGNDYIDQAEKLSVNYPYWAERKMNMFVPIMSAIDEHKIMPGQ
eukprot:403360655